MHVTVLVDTHHPGPAIPDDFIGLSFEMERLLPVGNTYYFTKSNKALIETFRNLGIRSLRVGGNTADTPSSPFPTIADIDQLFSFAKAADVKVIFTFRLRAGGPKRAALIAEHIVRSYPARLTCFAIGNEPDVYIRTYSLYRSELDQYISAFNQAGIDSDVRFCGPGTTPAKVEWARQFAHDFAHSDRIRYVTQHSYPGNSGRAVIDAAAGRAEMLSPAWVNGYESFYNDFAGRQGGDVPFRIEEANSFFHGGAKNVSDTFAAALWGLDYMHWWAAHNAGGINFHTGDRVAAADESTPCYYAVFLSSLEGYKIQPLGYAIKTFELAAHGRVVPVEIRSNGVAPNLTAYGTLSSNGALYVTLINKGDGNPGRAVIVKLVGGPGLLYASMMTLQNVEGKIAATDRITLGGSQLFKNGIWKGRWPRPVMLKDRMIEVRVQAGTATVVRMSAATPPSK